MSTNTDDDFTNVSAVSSLNEEGKDGSNTIANANTNTDAPEGIVIGGVPSHAQRTSNNEDPSSVTGVKSGESRTRNHGPTMPRRWKSDTRPRLLVDEIDMYSHHGRSVASIKSNYMPPGKIAMDSDDDDDDKDDDASSVTSVGSEAFKRASKTMRDENEKFERASRRFERELLEYNQAKDAHGKAVRAFQASLASRATNKVEDGGSGGSTGLGSSVVVVDDEAKVVKANVSTPAANDGAQSLSVPTHTGRDGSDHGSSLPREIELADDETEAEESTDASNDTQIVSDRKIVDPYGESGIYSGALSKSTDMPNGKGRLEYERAGRWYEGDWCHGRWTGFGRLANGDGDFYEGGLRNDHKHGKGKMKFADGRVFEGEYVRGQMVQGKMAYQDGSTYNGAWVDGMRHGKGKCVFADGSQYEGEFKEGSFHGIGKMTWMDGGWYEGEWADHEMHGKGKEIRPDGSLRHEGEWRHGQPTRN